MTKVLFVRNNVAEKSLMINWIEKKAFCREAKRNLMQPKVAQVFLRPVGAAQVHLWPLGRHTGPVFARHKISGCIKHCSQLYCVE